jgi:hypothetical protein
MCSWKMSPASEQKGSTRSSVIWPASGMTRDGQLYPLPRLEPHANAIGGGSSPDGEIGGNQLLPIPTASQYGSSQNGSNSNRPSAGTPSLQTRLNLWGTLWPTPTVADSRSTARHTTTAEASHAGTTMTDALRSRLGNAKARLSPRFVEWMMGYPVGWTDCVPSVMPSFPLAPVRPSASWPDCLPSSDDDECADAAPQLPLPIR